MWLIFSSTGTFESFCSDEDGQNYTHEGTLVGRQIVNDSPIELDGDITISALEDQQGRRAIHHRFSDYEIAEIEVRWDWYFSRGYMEFREELPGDWKDV